MRLAPALLLLLACGEAETRDAGPSIVDAGVTVSGDAGQGPIDSGPAPGCDQDNDGYVAQHCGGDDCDDRNRGVNPGGEERCSFEDENCSGVKNEGLDCTFFAHGREDLYRVDPFAERVETVARLQLPDGRYGVLDIDTDNDGMLIGVTRQQLLSFDEDGGYTELASIDTPDNINGLAIDSSNRIFLTQSGGEDAKAYTVDRFGAVNILGDLAPYSSSGDCVVLKDDSLLMTAWGENGDELVYVDSHDATTRAIGPIGFSKVYALSASFGFLFGLTDEGRVLLINPTTGAGEELFRREGKRFWGAANGD